ncbi:hypothetical protein [Adonisia turfae]|uniref:Uncharacterized protein n=1 Tax=Adonisia turfae CCMR0081 TaxID=2292702 RepID=A0A6M0RCP0_9CYAN|nr:hypothetical protein [Adonisia turfae]NEZ54148.1 hypothetical protein [Adonisia turfae CCMR0081]
MIYRLATLLFGDSSQLESFFFRVINFSFALLCIATFISNSYLGLPLILNTVIAMQGIIYLSLFILGIFKKISASEISVCIISTLLTLSVSWFSLEGSKGSTILFYLIATPIFLTFSRLLKLGISYLIFLEILIISNVSIVFYLEYMHPNLLTKYPSEVERTLDIFCSFIFTSVVASVALFIVKTGYEKEKIKDAENFYLKEIELKLSERKFS